MSKELKKKVYSAPIVKVVNTCDVLTASVEEKTYINGDEHGIDLDLCGSLYL